MTNKVIEKGLVKGREVKKVKRFLIGLDLI
jgi:hypothetical protein